MSSDFARMMAPVAIEILGEPNKALSSKTELRWGSRGSLSVDLTKGTWCDHSDGDRGGGVLDFLHVKEGLEKSDALEWLRERKHLPASDKAPAGKFNIVVTYDYHTAAGEMLFQVCRMDPKDFRQRRPDGRGGWIWKTSGMELVLYRLPEILDAVAKREQIYIAEGEKAVEALRSLGFKATCSPGGAGKWRPSYSEALKGASVTILPDNDEPGWQHAVQVETALRGIARRVCTIMLPGLPAKGDPADWVAAGNPAQALYDIENDMPEKPWPFVPPASDVKPGEAARQEQAKELTFIQPHKLQGIAVQPREWIAEDWLPVGSATLLFGDGGTGKTLLAQQLMTSCATGKPWVGLAVTRCRSLGIFCEDDQAELHRRQDRINRALGVEFDDLDDMTWASGVGQDNALMRFHADGKPARLPKLAEIKAQAIAFQARLIVLDTAADMFGGNENDRAQVRNFMGALNALAQEIGGAVLINAHPSRSGLSSTGDLDGGSTAWSNTARSRWSLVRPKADGEDPADTDERLLTRRKANYAAIGTEIRLRWGDGALFPPAQATGFAAAAMSSSVDAAFLDLLSKSEAEGRHISDSPNAGNYAPKAFSKRPDRQGFARREFEAAMQRLFAAGKIKMEEYGRSSAKGRPRHMVPVNGAQHG